MSVIEKSSLQKRLERLQKIFFFDERFADLATKLLLGRIGMLIYQIEMNYKHKRQKRGSNPLMYWEIGRELVEFVLRRERDHNKYRKSEGRKVGQDRIIMEVRGFLSELANQSVDDLEEIEEDYDEKDRLENEEEGDLKGNEERDKFKFSATDFSSRSLIRCFRLYQLIKNKEKIDPDVPWSIYAEYAEQYGRIKDFQGDSKFILLEELIRLRKEKGRGFSDIIARVYIYEFIRLINQTTRIRSNLSKIQKMIERNWEEIKSKGRKEVTEWYKGVYMKSPVKFT